MEVLLIGQTKPIVFITSDPKCRIPAFVQSKGGKTKISGIK